MKQKIKLDVFLLKNLLLVSGKLKVPELSKIRLL